MQRDTMEPWNIKLLNKTQIILTRVTVRKTSYLASGSTRRHNEPKTTESGAMLPAELRHHWKGLGLWQSLWNWKSDPRAKTQQGSPTGMRALASTSTILHFKSSPPKSTHSLSALPLPLRLGPASSLWLSGCCASCNDPQGGPDPGLGTHALAPFTPPARRAPHSHGGSHGAGGGHGPGTPVLLHSGRLSQHLGSEGAHRTQCT